MSSREICFMTAKEIVKQIKDRQLSVKEVMTAHLDQIDKINPKVNAIVTLVPDIAIKSAEMADKMLSRNESIGPLFGLPIAHKDLVETRGIRTTYGSPIFKDFIPEKDALIIERLKNAQCNFRPGYQIANFNQRTRKYFCAFFKTRF